MSLELSQFIVGGKLYDVSEFIIFNHIRGTLAGYKQYRHKRRGFFGPLLGYSRVRWVFTVDYEDEAPMHWEVVLTATIDARLDPERFENYMEALAKLAVDEWIGRYGIGWEAALINYETIDHQRSFHKVIAVDLIDKRRQHGSTVQLSFDWSESTMRRIGGLPKRKKPRPRLRVKVLKKKDRARWNRPR